ncbi:MAG: thiamine pyrophosphokinase [Verrucomicrobiales bacterium]|jgi:thiamine pyrophosphokinase
MTFAVVLVGGTVPDRQLLDGVAEAVRIIAADGGVRIARTHGLPIDVVVGDLDSASASDLAWARAEGATIVQFPPDKDQTDLELALDHADESGVDRIVAVGVDGGRLDHELGNWSALCAKRRALVEVRAASGAAWVLHADGHPRIELRGSEGDLVSLLPRLGAVSGVTTTGLRWPLTDATLSATSTHGVSNEFTGSEIAVEVGEGTLMVVRPTTFALDA